MPDLWNAIGLITGGLTLVAFLGEVCAFVYRGHLRSQEEIIKSAPDSDRANVILAKYSGITVPVDWLTREQRFDIANNQIGRNAAQFKIVAILAAILMVLMAILAIVAIVIAGKQDNAMLQGKYEEIKRSNEKFVAQVPIGPIAEFRHAEFQAPNVLRILITNKGDRPLTIDRADIEVKKAWKLDPISFHKIYVRSSHKYPVELNSHDIGYRTLVKLSQEVYEGRNDAFELAFMSGPTDCDALLLGITLNCDGKPVVLPPIYYIPTSITRANFESSIEPDRSKKNADLFFALWQQLNEDEAAGGRIVFSRDMKRAVEQEVPRELRKALIGRPKDEGEPKK